MENEKHTLEGRIKALMTMSDCDVGISPPTPPIPTFTFHISGPCVKGQAGLRYHGDAVPPHGQTGGRAPKSLS
ncbi:hypothetical protein NQZ68_025025 [Dissostichus eleginoides]|nr:hypothetical protein NQZ68_025025 [Dissostichus eleginoides]